MVEKTLSQITLEELTEYDDQWVEVHDGQLMEVDMSAASFAHGYISGKILSILKTFALEHRLGFVLPDNVTYVLGIRADNVQNTRLPDVSFVRRGRITPDMDLDKPFMGAPDLAVEVTSPGQTADSLRGRVRDYLQHGSEEVWVLYIATKEVYQYTSAAPNRPTIYGEADSFGSEALFPGLTVRVADLFDLSDLYAS